MFSKDTLIFVGLSFLKVLFIIYDVVTLPVYFALQKPWKKWIAARTVWGKPIRDDDPYSPIVRNVKSSINPLAGLSTIDELFRMTVITHGPKKCMGVREVLAEAEEYQKTGKTLKKLRLGDYRWYSYSDIDQRVETLSKGLLAIGLQSKRRILIFAETRIEWMLTLQACLRINVPVATVYATLGEEGIIHGINETEVSTIFTSQELLLKLEKVFHRIPMIKQIIYMENLRPVDISGFPDKVSVLKFSEVEYIGTTANNVVKPEPPKADDLAIIMYTSGSTGIPKGVLFTHKNMMATTAGFLDGLPAKRRMKVYIAYLPLAHSYELTAETVFLAQGAAIGYSSPYTITDKSTAVMDGCKGDITLVQPTTLATVPMMLDRIRKSVNEAIASKGSFAKEFFHFSMKYKHFWREKGFSTPILNRLVFSKVRQLIGGKVQLIICAGAPLSADTHSFILTSLNVKFIQVYAATESAASATLTSENDCSIGRVGPPLSNCYVKLVDWAEGGYKPTDKPHPRGEIVIGGDCITIGYFKNDSLTKECYKEEDEIRWFCTGDIGELFLDGTFKIIDRKKDLVKMQNGEYISLGKVEAEMKTCPLVDNICVIGNGFSNHLVSVVVPNIQQLQALAATLGKQNLTLEEMYQDESVVTAFTKKLVEHGKKCGLQRREIPMKCKICSEEWIPDTGLVTAALKLRRKAIEKFYKNEIHQMQCGNSSAKTELVSVV